MVCDSAALVSALLRVCCANRRAYLYESSAAGAIVGRRRRMIVRRLGAVGVAHGLGFQVQHRRVAVLLHVVIAVNAVVVVFNAVRRRYRFFLHALAEVFGEAVAVVF